MEFKSVKKIENDMNKKFVRKSLILAGSNSDIGIEVVRILIADDPWDIHLVGRTKPDLATLDNDKTNFYFYECDFLDKSQTDSVIANIFQSNKPDLALIAIGSLPSENSELDLESTRLTLETNAIAAIRLVQLVTASFLENKNGTLILFSSVAAERPRLKNFTYGASKKAADFYTFGLANKVKNRGVQIKILRLGYVYSKMSRNFPAAPFAITKETAAQKIVSSLNSKRIIQYIPGRLRVIFCVLRFLPWSIFSRLE